MCLCQPTGYNHCIEVDNKSFENVAMFNYFGTAVKIKISLWVLVTEMNLLVL